MRKDPCFSAPVLSFEFFVSLILWVFDFHVLLLFLSFRYGADLCRSRLVCWSYGLYRILLMYEFLYWFLIQRNYPFPINSYIYYLVQQSRSISFAVFNIFSDSKSYQRHLCLGQLACLPELPEDKEDKPLDIYSFVNSTKTPFTPVVTNPSLLQVSISMIVANLLHNIHVFIGSVFTEGWEKSFITWFLNLLNFLKSYRFTE